MINVSNYLEAAGWREDLQTAIITAGIAAILTLVFEAVVCFTPPKSRVGDFAVIPMVLSIGALLGGLGVAGYIAKDLPFNDAYWKTYTISGPVMAADYAVSATGEKSPAAILDIPVSTGRGLMINMTDNSLKDYVGQNVQLTCELFVTEAGSSDYVCSFATLYQEASA
jgi:hypothetical protein